MTSSELGATSGALGAGPDAGELAASSDAAIEWRKPTASDVEKNESLYEVAYDESRRSLDDQSLELSNLRTRAVQFLAFVGTATAFLVGTSIRSLDRHASFYALASAASLLALISVVLVVAVLSPWSTPLRKRVDARRLLTTWIERDVPVANKAAMLRELSLHYDKWRRSNEDRLWRIRVMYVAAIGVGALQLVLWSVLVWITA